MKTLLAVILLSVFVLVSFGNGSLLIRFWRTKKTASLVPLLGGAAGAGALVLSDLFAAKWWWVPVMLEPGTGPLLLGVVWRFVARSIERRRG